MKLLVVILVSGVCEVSADTAEAGVEKLKTRLRNACQALDQVNTDLEKRISEINQSPEMAPLTKALEQAEAAKQKTYDSYRKERSEEARNAYKKAYSAYRKAHTAHRRTMMKMKASDKTLASLKERMHTLEKQIEELRMKIRRATTDVIIKTGSTWKYSDVGKDLGEAWRAAAFDDTAWKSGPARLGYGNDGEVTVVSFGPDKKNKHPTTYFRTEFNIDNVSRYKSLTVRLLRDDGAVVYLNGIEVVRDHMPEGDITYRTRAGSNKSRVCERTFYEHEIPKTNLANGRNVLAVEIHQQSAGSSDLSFDLELLGMLVRAHWRKP